MIRARKSYIYTPDDRPDAELPLFLRGSLLTESPTEEWTENTVTQAYIGRTYAAHRDGGGRYLTLTCTVLTRHRTMAELELYAQQRQHFLHAHPQGTMRAFVGYTGNTPALVLSYRATLVNAKEVPAHAEQNDLGNIAEPAFEELETGLLPQERGSGTAWLAMEYSFILTPVEEPDEEEQEEGTADE